MNVLRNRFTAELVSTWDALRTSYWFLPMVMVAMAAAASLGLIEIDRRMATEIAERVPWIQDADADGTRALLSAIAGSMITVTGVVFSITIVALTLASSQFGPRLLRNFLRDRGNQLVLGTFVSTFLYTLLVLRAVYEGGVPHLATAGGLVLAVTSVFVLIYFVHHAASSIQASSVIAGVAAEIDAELPRLFPERLGEGAASERRDEPGMRDPGTGSREIHAEDNGYVRVLNTEQLLALAVKQDLVLHLERRPGDFVAEGDRLARAAPGERVSDETESELRECFVIGPQRSAVQDIAFLTDQLTEMALRALSPGINDPGTAVACVHRLGAVIGDVAHRAMPVPERYDEEGCVRVVARPTTFDSIVASCLDPIRRYGAKDAGVVEAVLLALAAVVEGCPDRPRRELLLEHAREWSQAFAREASASKRDEARIAVAFDRVERGAAAAADGASRG